MQSSIIAPPPSENPDTLTIGQILYPANMPIFTCDLSSHAVALQLARQAIDELRAADPTPLQSNVKAVYTSPWDSHYKNPKFDPLCQIVKQVALHVSKVFLTADFPSINLDYFVKDCWGIIYESSDHTVKHNHFPSEMSCSIYLEADPNCAPIVFENGMQIQPQPNLLVMFPGILNHEVPATPGRRVVVAMNLFKMAKFN